MAKKDERIVWWVEHPAHAVAVVQAPDWPLATVEAAKWWDVPWREVAAECICRRREALPRYVCGDCGEIFYGREEGRTRCALCEAKARNDEARRRAREARHWREVSRGLRES